jgi:L-aspartate oxidase
MAALAAAPAPVILLDPNGPGAASASALSQGGLAAAIGNDDEVDLHIADTLAAGAGLCEPKVVSRIIGAGPALVDNLLRHGVRLDRDAAGRPALGLEAAHSRKRILHANGDQTGAEILRALVNAARHSPSIQIFDASARHVFMGDSGVTGVLAVQGSEKLILPADRVLLATGGIGGLFPQTTNPRGAIGHGLMLAMQAGATFKNLEFIQFHPTALAIDAAPLPLISEAVRGEGAVFIDETGERFMRGHDLAPRDVVARGVFAHLETGHKVFLDARGIGKRFAARFPTIHAVCITAGINPCEAPIPVCPAAHYHMGGVAVDAYGRTDIEGLFAAGEVACTGLHGANRLASNSLLEAAICGAEAGRFMASLSAKRRHDIKEIALPPLPDPDPVRSIMSQSLGILRNAAGLCRAISLFADQAKNPAAALGLRIAQAALARKYSVGAHARLDDPRACAAGRPATLHHAA